MGVLGFLFGVNCSKHITLDSVLELAPLLGKLSLLPVWSMRLAAFITPFNPGNLNLSNWEAGSALVGLPPAPDLDNKNPASIFSLLESGCLGDSFFLMIESLLVWLSPPACGVPSRPGMPISRIWGTTLLMEAAFDGRPITELQNCLLSAIGISACITG